MQATGHLIGAFIELTSGMQHREHHFKSTFVLFFVHVHRYAAAVVDHGYGIIGIYSNFNMMGIARKSLVDRVVHHLIDKMVQTLGGNVAYVHRRTLADGFQPFKHLDITGAIFLFFFSHNRFLIVFVN